MKPLDFTARLRFTSSTATYSVPKMDASKWTPPTNTALGSVECCCNHTHCAPLRNQRCCKRWYSIHLASAKCIPGDCLMQKIRACLSITRCLVAISQHTEDGAFYHAVMLHFRPGQPTLTSTEYQRLESAIQSLLDAMENVDFAPLKFLIIPLLCCAEDMLMQGSFWASVAEKAGPVVSGCHVLPSLFMSEIHCCIAAQIDILSQQGCRKLAR